MIIIINERRSIHSTRLPNIDEWLRASFEAHLSPSVRIFTNVCPPSVPVQTENQADRTRYYAYQCSETLNYTRRDCLRQL